MASRRRWLVGAFVCTLVWAGGAAAGRADERDIDPNQGESLVEVNVPNKGAAMRLQLEADRYGVEFNEHYLRNNRDGSVTVTVFADEQGLDRLDAAGYEIARTIEGPKHVARPGRAARDRRAEGAARGSGRARRADHDHLARGRARHPARRLLRELHRALPVGRGEDAAGLGGSGERAPTPARRSRSRGTAAPGTEIDSQPAQHELEHRPRHDAGHVHRAPPAHADRRRRHAATRRRRRGSGSGRALARRWRATSARGSAADCRRWRTAS